jgi:hypothetical protein
VIEDVEDAEGQLGNGSRRVIRGGSFQLKAVYISAAKREATPPEASSHSFGFRVARTIR